jgi:hypothetical protein
MIRARIASGIGRLDRLKSRFLYLPVSTSAMLQTANLWADIRQRAFPTASPESLDPDCVLARMPATAFDASDAVMLATNNPVHLVRFSDGGLRYRLANTSLRFFESPCKARSFDATWRPRNVMRAKRTKLRQPARTRKLVGSLFAMRFHS